MLQALREGSWEGWWMEPCLSRKRVTSMIHPLLLGCRYPHCGWRAWKPPRVVSVNLPASPGCERWLWPGGDCGDNCKKHLVLSCACRCPLGSSEEPLEPTAEHEVLQCLNLVFMLLQHFLEQIKPLPSVQILLRILGMFVGKEDLLQANKVASGPRALPFACS